MRGTLVDYENVVVYPEYAKISLKSLVKKSLQDIGEYYYFFTELAPINHYGQKGNLLRVVYRGDIIYSRYKYRLYETEALSAVKPGDTPPRTISVGNHRLLPLICYEMMFPEDYMNQTIEPNLVVHLVGFPMFDDNQKEGWVAMHKALAMHYNCPVVCCCGGERGSMNISGVTMP